MIGVALLAWVFVQATSDNAAPTPQPTATATSAPTQSTLLIQVRNDADFGSDNLVAGVGADLPPAQLLVPSRLIVDVAGAGQQTLGQSARLLDRSASQDALSDLLAVRIDGTLSLGRLALAGMVDFVGGITLTVDEPITETDPATGVTTVVVPEGRQQLNGTQAAAYALTWLPEEPEAARLARYSAVITETVRALPDDALRIEQMLTSLGGSARTTTSTAAVASMLLELRRSIIAGGQQVRVLPTSDVESGADLSLVRVDLAAADPVLQTLLPKALLDASEARPRILVQNGVGTPGLGASARDKLAGAGMVYINGGNAEQFGQPATQVLVPDATTASRALGAEVAEALGVPATAVQVAQEGQNVADAVVVLGADFQP
ncbi:MAG TPA: LCP family protein [Candidatus Nanopelagicales bacterium]